MMVKKIMLLAISSLLAMSMMQAFSGGAEATTLVRYNGIYLETDIGYADVDWRNYALGITNFTSAASPTSNTMGGFSVSGVGGYQFDEFWSLEGGWFYLPEVSGTVNNVSAIARGWFVYGAAKLTMPIHPDIYVFGKFGAAVRYTYLSATSALTHLLTGQVLPVSAYYWTPLFAVGIQYYFTWNWSVNAQYLRVPGYQRFISAASTNNLNVPAINLLTVGLGVKIGI